MATMSNEDLRAIHESIWDAMPDGAVFYCVIFNPDDGSVSALDNAEDPQDIREVARELLKHELRSIDAIRKMDAVQQ